MAEMKDLEQLFPDKETGFSFVGSDDGEKYSVKLFLSTGLVLLYEKLTKDENMLATEVQIQVLEKFFINQYEHMNREWIEKNISMQKQNYIFLMFIQELNRGNEIISNEMRQVEGVAGDLSA